MEDLFLVILLTGTVCTAISLPNEIIEAGDANGSPLPARMLSPMQDSSNAFIMRKMKDSYAEGKYVGVLEAKKWKDLYETMIHDMDVDKDHIKQKYQSRAEGDSSLALDVIQTIRSKLEKQYASEMQYMKAVLDRTQNQSIADRKRAVRDESKLEEFKNELWRLKRVQEEAVATAYDSAFTLATKNATAAMLRAKTEATMVNGLVTAKVQGLQEENSRLSSVKSDLETRSRTQQRENDALNLEVQGKTRTITKVMNQLMNVTNEKQVTETNLVRKVEALQDRAMQAENHISNLERVVNESMSEKELLENAIQQYSRQISKMQEDASGQKANFDRIISQEEARLNKLNYELSVAKKAQLGAQQKLQELSLQSTQTAAKMKATSEATMVTMRNEVNDLKLRHAKEKEEEHNHMEVSDKDKSLLQATIGKKEEELNLLRVEMKKEHRRIAALELEKNKLEFQMKEAQVKANSMEFEMKYGKSA